MRRHAFIGVMAGVAAWPTLGRAEQTDRMRRVGVLLLFYGNDAETETRFCVFERGLRDMGWVQGENIQIEYRFAACDITRQCADVNQPIALPVDVIVTSVTAASALRVHDLAELQGALAYLARRSDSCLPSPSQTIRTLSRMRGIVPPRLLARVDAVIE
jgi:hypothetical protein